MADDEEQPDGDTSESIVEIESRSSLAVPGWERRLTRREKLRRGLVATAVVSLAFLLLLGGPGALIARTLRVPRALQSPAPAQPSMIPTPMGLTMLPESVSSRFSAAPWERISSPDPALPYIAYAPFPTDPAIMYACAVVPRDVSAPQFTSGSVRVWRTGDAGQRWQPLSFPDVQAYGCAVRTAPDAPSRLLLEASTYAGDSASCPKSVFLSGDGGASWHQMALASAPQPGGVALGCLVSVTSRHVYENLQYCDRNGGASCQTAGTMLFRSDDDGESWIPIALDLAATGYVWLTVLSSPGASDVLLASSIVMPPPPMLRSGTHVWMSSNSGSSWIVLSNPTIDLDSTLMTAPGARGDSPASWQILYGFSGDQIPSDTWRLSIAESPDGQTWFGVPPLPVPGADPQRLGIVRVIGEAMDGKLLVLGMDSEVGISQRTPVVPGAMRLWAWDPAKLRWEVSPLRPPVPIPMSGSVLGSGLTTSGPGPDGASQGTYVWVEGADPRGVTELYRTFVPTE